MFQSGKIGFEQIAKSRQELDAMVPKSSASGIDLSQNPCVIMIKKSLDEINEVTEQKSKVMSEGA